jgi:hypothetical protein
MQEKLSFNLPERFSLTKVYLRVFCNHAHKRAHYHGTDKCAATVLGVLLLQGEVGNVLVKFSMSQYNKAWKYNGEIIKRNGTMQVRAAI